MRFWLKQFGTLFGAAWRAGFRYPVCRHGKPGVSRPLIEFVTAHSCSRCVKEWNDGQDNRRMLVAWEKRRAEIERHPERPIVSETSSLLPPAGIPEGACMNDIYRSFVDGNRYWFERRQE